MRGESEFEAYLSRPRVTLDMVGLSEAERREGSIFMGGSGIDFVRPDDKFNPRDVGVVVFNWGDKRVEDVFAVLLEHDDIPDKFSKTLIPFSPSTIIGDVVWSLTLQDGEFDPDTAYPSSDFYHELPFDEQEGSAALQKILEGDHPSLQIISKIGSRWVLFGLATYIR